MGHLDSAFSLSAGRETPMWNIGCCLSFISHLPFLCIKIFPPTLSCGIPTFHQLTFFHCKLLPHINMAFDSSHVFSPSSSSSSSHSIALSCISFMGWYPKWSSSLSMICGCEYYKKWQGCFDGVWCEWCYPAWASLLLRSSSSCSPSSLSLSRGYLFLTLQDFLFSMQFLWPPSTPFRCAGLNCTPVNPPILCAFGYPSRAFTKGIKDEKYMRSLYI